MRLFLDLFALDGLPPRKEILSFSSGAGAVRHAGLGLVRKQVNHFTVGLTDPEAPILRCECNEPRRARASSALSSISSCFETALIVRRLRRASLRNTLWGLLSVRKFGALQIGHLLAGGVSTSRSLRAATLMGSALAAAAGFFAAPAHAEPREITSKIEAVTVFLDGALVTRGAALDLDAGPAVPAFKDLPTDLDPASLRVTGTADADLAIDSIATHLAPAVSKPDGAIKAQLADLRSQRQTRDIHLAYRMKWPADRDVTTEHVSSLAK
jgi:hypothetical protein